MAQLNPPIARPVGKYDPNGIARITPKASRHYAKQAYRTWVEGGMSAPWDGAYTDDDGPVLLDYI